MDRLDVMRLFVRVADTGSFSRTARAAGIAQPTVSKQVAALEKRLGAQLLRRTSRGLSLTEAGQQFYESAIRLLEDFEAAEARVGHGQIPPSGRVRVAMSAAFGRIYVIPRLPEFFARFPGMSFDFDISERHVNLIEDGIDVAIRMGHLSDSTLRARRIGSMHAVTVATPGYLAAFGEPSTPADLQDHTGVSFIFQGAVLSWGFKGPEGSLAITPKEILRTNDAEHIRAAVLAGLGIGHAAGWLFADDLRSGALTRLLPDYAPPPYPINAVWAGNRLLPGKVKAFIDFLAEICAGDEHLKID